MLLIMNTMPARLIPRLNWINKIYAWLKLLNLCGSSEKFLLPVFWFMQFFRTLVGSLSRTFEPSVSRSYAGKYF